MNAEVGDEQLRASHKSPRPPPPPPPRCCWCRNTGTQGTALIQCGYCPHKFCVECQIRWPEDRECPHCRDEDNGQKAPVVAIEKMQEDRNIIRTFQTPKKMQNGSELVMKAGRKRAKKTKKPAAEETKEEANSGGYHSLRCREETPSLAQLDGATGHRCVSPNSTNDCLAVLTLDPVGQVKDRDCLAEAQISSQAGPVILAFAGHDSPTSIAAATCALSGYHGLSIPPSRYDSDQPQCKTALLARGETLSMADSEGVANNLVQKTASSKSSTKKKRKNNKRQEKWEEKEREKADREGMEQSQRKQEELSGWVRDQIKAVESWHSHGEDAWDSAPPCSCFSRAPVVKEQVVENEAVAGTLAWLPCERSWLLESFLEDEILVWNPEFMVALATYEMKVVLDEISPTPLDANYPLWGFEGSAGIVGQEVCELLKLSDYATLAPAPGASMPYSKKGCRDCALAIGAVLEGLQAVDFRQFTISHFEELHGVLRPTRLLAPFRQNLKLVLEEVLALFEEFDTISYSLTETDSQEDNCVARQALEGAEGATFSPS